MLSVSSVLLYECYKREPEMYEFNLKALDDLLNNFNSFGNVFFHFNVSF